MHKVTDELEQLASVKWEIAMPGPVWSWWLAGAKPDGAGLRRWQLWIWWTRQQGMHNKLSAAIRFLRGYIEAPHEVSVALRRFGEKTQSMHGVSRLTQFRQLLMLRWRFGMRPELYYRYQLFKPDQILAAPNYLKQIEEFLLVISRHSPRTKDERIFLCKEDFRRWCEVNQIPTVTTLLQITSGKVVWRLNEQLPTLDLFVKPTNWIKGKGISRWQYASSKHGHHYTNSSGRELSASELEAFVCRTSLQHGRPYIVQPALTNHQTLRGFTNGALATVRFMTVRGSGQPAQPLMAALRMPTGDAIADNFDLGGVAAPIDLKTGTCGGGVRLKDQLPPDTVTTHPDTGSAITGLAIPYWPETIALTCRAHDLIHAHVPVIGWDVAILDRGPVLVEPNWLPGDEIAQMPGGFPLGDSLFAEIVTARLRETFLNGKSRGVSNA